MQTRLLIVYCSPAGTTRRVALAIESELKHRTREEVLSVDLGREHDWSAGLKWIGDPPADVCLFIGSPVYRDLAVTPVMQFIQALPRTKRGFAVPFVTWGHVCSGIALWEMGIALQERGYSLAGALKVPSLHSMMWSIPNPLGEGQPDENSIIRIGDFVGGVCTKLQNKPFRPLDTEVLVDQPPEWVGPMQEKLAQARPTTPKTIIEPKCTQCGICRDVCPAAAIELNPYPEFGAACFDCFNCIRHCPEEAIETTPPLPVFREHIRKRALLMNETPCIREFL